MKNGRREHTVVEENAPQVDRRPVVASVAAALTTSAPPRSTAAQASVIAQRVDQPQKARVFCAEDDEQLTWWQHMLAGATAGMSEHLLMFPVDTLKTRMQSYVALRHDHTSIGLLSATRSLIATEGYGALWRGAGAVALSAGPAHALHFATYEKVRWTLMRGAREEGAHEGARPIETAVAASCATVVSDAIMTPLDVVKQRMQLSGRETYVSVAHCVRRVYEFHGIGAFYAGFKATLVMNVPFMACYFASYESVKHALLKARRANESDFDVGAHCVAGGVAGGVAAAGTNGLDVVKTRLQTQGEVGARRYGGMTEALKVIAREEGLRGLMRGVRARVLFHVPAAAICWTTYEFCKHAMAVGGADGAADARAA